MHILVLDEEYVQDPTEIELMKSMGLPTQFCEGERRKMKRKKKQKKGYIVVYFSLQKNWEPQNLKLPSKLIAKLLQQHVLMMSNNKGMSGCHSGIITAMTLY